ncbi:MAG: hypothetical protein V1837_05675 [Candidatus Woesearchaeota archaeon]
MKRGQLTVFIILGLAMLLAFSLFFILQNAQTKFEPDVIIPEEVMPIRQYIDQCVYDLAKDAVVKLGLQSGFIEIPPDIGRNPASYISVDPFGLVIRPYWYYRGQARIPNENYLRYQIARYVEQNLPSCDFKVFSKEFDIRTGPPIATAALQDKSVSVNVNYPVEIHYLKLEKVVRMANFTADLPVKLKSVYKLATDIMDAENNRKYLENITIDLMAADPTIPFTGMEFQCGSLEWPIAGIKSELQSTLFYNIPRIRIDNTDFAAFDQPKSVYEKFKKYTMKDINEGNLPATNPPADAYEFNHFLLDVGSSDPSLKAKFIYKPQYGMDLMGYPSADGVLKSSLVEGQGQYLQFLCVNIYHFTYDITYPVEVWVRDDSAFGGTGYLFAFAFPVTIHQNKPDRADRGAMVFETPSRGQGFCQSRGEDQYSFTAFGTFEGYTDMEIPDVDISYECLNYHCSLGKTKADSGHYRLNAYLPSGCTNPYIIANKTGYLPARQQVLAPAVNVPMKKIKQLNLNVVKHVYQESSKTLGEAEPLASDEKVVIALDLLNNSFRQFAQFQNLTVSLGFVEDNADYSLDIVFLHNNDHVGGYTNNNFHLSISEVAQAESVTLHVVDYRPSPVTEEQKLNMASYLFEGNYKDKLKPELK